MWFHALEYNDNDTPGVTRFDDYVTEQWVESLNHYDNGGPRTTNNVEGWHSKINKICKTAHPNIYTIMKMLQNIQSTNEAKLIQLSAGGKQRTKKRMHRQLDSLQQLKTRFRNGTLNVVDYADAASHLLHID